MFPAFVLLAQTSLAVATTPHSPPVQFTVKSGQGLNLTLNGIPIVRGSWLQYYAEDWSEGYYSTATTKQTIETLPSGATQVKYSSKKGEAFGTETFTESADGLKAEFAIGWNGKTPVNVELTGCTLWADPIQAGSLSADGKPTRPLSTASAAGDTLEARTYAHSAKDLSFDLTAGKLLMHGNGADWTVYDARNLKQTWTEGKRLFWVGIPALQIAPGQVKTVSIEFHFQAKTADAPVATGDTFRLSAQPLANALFPSNGDLPIIPTPQQALVNRDDPMVLPNDIALDIPSDYPNFGKLMVKEIKRLWDVPNLRTHNGTDSKIFLRIQNLGLAHGGYDMTLNSHTCVIQCQDEDGVANAMRTIAQLVFVKDGHLCLPTARVRDWPSVLWRGAHLVVGPQSLDFQQRLWDNVLLPLKMNQVVLECEQTNWDAIKGAETSLTMDKKDLVRLFDMYRSRGLDPIPLIQSFGHMGWLFENGKNLDLALDKNVPFNIDPRVPRSREVLTSIWNEAIELLHPRTIHFGLDEVDTKGYPSDPNLASSLWEQWLPFLSSIALDHRLNMMLWGDQCLAPGQAVDAALGNNMEQAKKRLDAIPKGAWICDWHYKNDEDPERFLQSLQLWKDQGMYPIAATWFNPQNIHGFYQAAYKASAGTLQTTWVGFESSEETMLREFKQFSAMVIAADYAWSGRQESVANLGYDPAEVFTRMFYGKPSKLNATAGMSCGSGAAPVRIGDVSFSLVNPMGLKSMTSPALSQLPSSLKLETPGLRGTELALALDTAVGGDDGQPVADVKVELEDGRTVSQSLYYGRQVRCATDKRPIYTARTANGLSAVRITLDHIPVGVKRVVITSTSSFAGLRVHGVTTF